MDRSSLVAAYRELIARGLSQGTAGNISVRLGRTMLITPSALPAARMRAADIAAMDIAGEGAWRGRAKPSSEWRIHRDIYRARPEIGAVVHAHPPYATALAMARRPIPPAHYMVALFGGDDVRCAPYATFGTAALSAVAVAALAERKACLLANHGCLALGQDLAEAMANALELETLSQQYLLSLAAGPVLLSKRELADALAAFGAYRGGGEPAASPVARGRKRRA
ncbi:MAG: class II aldolase/adducin family protein [Rhodospirillales bacterium]|jgi:L-fuculose-phosphate aldolase|nr:class II aldolase/adducin family protein [Rhodospirillales bacterium]